MFAIFLICLFAALVQAGVGFGSALVAMPLLVMLLGARTAAPLWAIVGFLTVGAGLLHFRRAIQFRTVVRLVAASAIGTPAGVWLIKNIDANVANLALGLLLTGYSIYALFAPSLPELKRQEWSFPFGFVGGVLNGAFNTAGPPLVMYGAFRRWPPDRFKGNLQGVFFVSGFVTLVSHVAAGNFTPEVWRILPWAISGVTLGLFPGLWLGERIDEQRARKLTFLLLIGLGIRLILQ